MGSLQGLGWPTRMARSVGQPSTDPTWVVTGIAALPPRETALSCSPQAKKKSKLEQGNYVFALRQPNNKTGPMDIPGSGCGKQNSKMTPKTLMHCCCCHDYVMLNNKRNCIVIMKVAKEILKYGNHPHGPDLITWALKTKVFCGWWSGEVRFVAWEGFDLLLLVLRLGGLHAKECEWPSKLSPLLLLVTFTVGQQGNGISVLQVQEN